MIGIHVSVYACTWVYIAVSCPLSFLLYYCDEIRDNGQAPVTCTETTAWMRPCYGLASGVTMPISLWHKCDKGNMGLLCGIIIIYGMQREMAYQ